MDCFGRPWDGTGRAVFGRLKRTRSSGKKGRLRKKKEESWVEDFWVRDWGIFSWGRNKKNRGDFQFRRLRVLGNFWRVERIGIFFRGAKGKQEIERYLWRNRTENGVSWEGIVGQLIQEEKGYRKREGRGLKKKEIPGAEADSITGRRTRTTRGEDHSERRQRFVKQTWNFEFCVCSFIVFGEWTKLLSTGALF